MTPAIGHLIEWCRGNGKISRMVVDRIHHADDDIWLFGWWGASWAAVNQKFVLSVKQGGTRA